MSENAEAVALRLLEMLMEHEQFASEFKDKPAPEARSWLLTAYGECLRAVISGKERAENRLGRGRERGRGGDAEGGAVQGRPRKRTPVAPLSED